MLKAILLGALLLNFGVDIRFHNTKATVVSKQKARFQSTGFGKTEYDAREEAKRNARKANNDKAIRIISHKETKLGDKQYTSVIIWEDE